MDFDYCTTCNAPREIVEDAIENDDHRPFRVLHLSCGHHIQLERTN